MVFKEHLNFYSSHVFDIVLLVWVSTLYISATMLPSCYPHATPIPPLTVEVAAQQLQTQGGVPLHHDGLDPDVARHDGRGEAVVLHTGAVHVPLKVLNRDRKHGYTQVTLLTCASIIHLKQ